MHYVDAKLVSKSGVNHMGVSEEFWVTPVFSRHKKNAKMKGALEICRQELEKPFC